jgi:dTDP-4-amino-4,6-dideoxygalactose transaminase
LNTLQIQQLQRLLLSDDASLGEEIISDYEKKFASQVGNGYAVSFAAGRMAFFVAMKVLGVKEGDEIILPAFTCSVMPNAVLRCGATPVYADIDARTLGSSLGAIKKLISKKTRVIVAQHSFGIPCDVEAIVKFAKENNIFVIEDCALTFDSSVNGIKVGNFGDAAIFSTDHSKPINTIIGGILFTKQIGLYKKIQTYSDGLPSCSIAHQKNLFEQFKFERNYFSPNKYSRIIFFNMLNRLRQFIYREKLLFLIDDSSESVLSRNYPYPSKLPAFLALLGLFELDRWPLTKKYKKDSLQYIKNLFVEVNFSDKLPKIYLDESRDISPLRIVFLSKSQKFLLKRFSRFIDVNWVWFRKPIIGATVDLDRLNYRSGSAPIAEEICTQIINLPCSVDSQFEQIYDKYLRAALRR